jgi:hypothetical protein
VTDDLGRARSSSAFGGILTERDLDAAAPSNPLVDAHPRIALSRDSQPARLYLAETSQKAVLGSGHRLDDGAPQKDMSTSPSASSTNLNLQLFLKTRWTFNKN